MAKFAVQNMIYRTVVKSPLANRVANGFGNGVNRALRAVGSKVEYATGLTRNKATLFATPDPRIGKRAEIELLATDRTRAIRAVLEMRNNDFDPCRDLLQGEVLVPKETFDSMLNAGFSGRQALVMTANILKRTDRTSYLAFRELSDALPGMRDKLSADKTYDLIMDILKNARSYDHCAISTASDLISSGFNHAQVIGLISLVATSSADIYEASDVFKEIRKALPKIVKLLPPDESTDAIKQTLIRVNKFRNLAIKALPELIDNTMFTSEAVAICEEVTNQSKSWIDASCSFDIRLQELASGD